MRFVLLLLGCTIALTSAWSVPYHPVRSSPGRILLPPRHQPIHRAPVHKPIHEPIHDSVHEPAQESEVEDENWQRAKRDHHDDYHGNSNHGGITGPVHTFVKTDKNANYKWGVRHHVGPKYV